MDTKSIIKLFIDSNYIVRKPSDYSLYFKNLYPRLTDWMSNVSFQNRIKTLVFGNAYVNSCVSIKQKMSNTLSKSEKFDVWTIINDGKKWGRRIRGNQGIKGDSDILQYAVLLTTTLAMKLRNTYNRDSFKQFAKILRLLSVFLNNELPNQIMAKICPFNFSKEYNDWQNIINNDKCSNIDLYPITSYDIMCAYVFLALWHCNRAESEITERNIVFEQWNLYVLECADNDRITLRNKTSEDIGLIFDSIESIKAEEDISKEIPEMVGQVADNELYRDSKFLRQSNLYKAVDLKAINRVLQLIPSKELIVLDLGCGDGEVSCSRFGKCGNFSKIIALDNDESQIAIAKRKVIEKGFEEKFIFANLDMNSDLFVEELVAFMSDNDIRGFDVIFAALSLHKTKYPETIVNKLSDSVLNEGGFFVIREMDDDTKIYYYGDAPSTNLITEAADEYKKIFGFTDRNCARKMYSWLINSGLDNVEVFYDVIDTCNKSRIEKSDIFNIMVGFRKERAEKELNKWSIEDKEKYQQYELSCKRIISFNNDLLKLFHNDNFWFLAINYIAIAQKPIIDANNLPPVLKRDVEILLIRHAEGTFNDCTTTYRINEEGRKQIKDLADYLANTKIDGIYSSSMERAIDSAKPIADMHHLKINVYKELDEIDRGEIITDEKWGLYNDYYLRWKKHEEDLEFPDGENGEAVWLRAKFVIDQIISGAKSHNESSDVYRVCVFTHGGTLRSLVCGMLGIPQSSRYQLIEEFDNCSITRIKVNSNSFSNINTSNPFVMVSLNDTSYRKRGK